MMASRQIGSLLVKCKWDSYINMGSTFEGWVIFCASQITWNPFYSFKIEMSEDFLFLHSSLSNAVLYTTRFSWPKIRFTCLYLPSSVWMWKSSLVGRPTSSPGSRPFQFKNKTLNYFVNGLSRVLCSKMLKWDNLRKYCYIWILPRQRSLYLTSGLTGSYFVLSLFLFG